MLKIANRGTVKQFEHLKKLGYDAVDYRGFCCAPGTGLFAVSDNEFKECIKRDAGIAREIGIEINQTHGVWPYDDTKKELEELKFKAMIRSIEGTALIGAEYVVIHPVMPFMWTPSPRHEEDIQININYLSQLIPYAEYYNVKLALENMPINHLPCGRVSELIRCIDTVDSSYLVACLDTGHCTSSGENVGDAIRLLDNRLSCLHIHDNDGRKDQHLMPYMGVTDWSEFTQALQDIGYNGIMTLESTIPANIPESLFKDIEEWQVKAISYLSKEVCKDIL